MDFRLSEAQERWVSEIRAFLDEYLTPEASEEIREYQEEAIEHPHARAFLEKVAEKGWYGLLLPEELGGLNRSAFDQYLLVDEFEYRGVPRPEITTLILAPTIARVGTPEQRAYWVPRLLSGEVILALGYSEPNAGSDLASLRTTAVLDGDEWVINGQKIWNSAGHRATHEWLAVRTDPAAPKHKGISMVIVPMDAPGITIRPLTTWLGPAKRTNEAFFDNVRVPKENLIGEVNQGWNCIRVALDFERLTIGPTGLLRRLYEDPVTYVKETTRDGRVLGQDPVIRHQLARLRVDLEIARMLSLKTADLIDRGLVPTAEASMTKIETTEVRARLADTGTHILDLYGQLDWHEELAPLRGAVEFEYRRAPYLRFGGGTNEIQRDIVAQQGLGLPRSR